MSDRKQLYYRAKKLEECTRDELMACCHWLMERQEHTMLTMKTDREMEALFASTRERLGLPR